MPRFNFCCFSLVVIFAFHAPGFTQAVAQDSTDVNVRLAELQQEMAELRAEIESPIRQTSYTPTPYGFGCGEECTAGKNGSQNCSCSRNPVFQIGAEFLFAKPHMKESFDSTVMNVVTGQQQLIPLSFDRDLAPRFWGQINTASGVGIRAKYWSFDDGFSSSAVATPTTFPGATAVTVIFPAAISTMAPGDILNTSMSLDVDTLDIEGTKQMTMAGVYINGGVGLRHARMEQVVRDAVVRGGNTIQSLAWHRSFNGIGPTVSGDVRYPLGQGGFSAVTNIRGSLLFGEKTISRTVVGDVTPPPNTTLPIVSLNDADEVSGIFELALGLEYSRNYGRFGDVFVRGMYEGQLWTAAGAPTLTFLGFDGFSIAIGLTR